MSTSSELSSPGMTDKNLRRPRRARVEPHHYSNSNYSKEVHLQEKKGQTRFYKGRETRILAPVMCQIESRKMASRKKIGKNIFYLSKIIFSRRGLRNFGSKAMNGRVRK